MITKEINMTNINDFSSQEVFDKVVKDLLLQGEASSGDDKQCMYRKGRLKCAVGHLMSENEYVPEMEGITVAGLGDFLPDGALVKHWGLLSALQSSHDIYLGDREDDKLFVEQLKYVAERFSLDYNFDTLKIINIENIHEFSEQDIFNRAAHHLMTQNKQSNSESSGLCEYLNKDGLKCAVGVFFTTTQYNMFKPDCNSGDSSFNSLVFYNVFGDSCKLEINDSKTRLLNSLQGTHDLDNAYSDKFIFEKSLRQVAKDFGLDAQVIDSYKS